jgi:multiple sugar transport system permease protein
MSHISPIGRRSWKVRAGLAALYAVLVAGAVTTVYPFLLMVSTATKSQVDYNEFTPSALIPRYVRDPNALYVKYIEDRYANNLDDINAAHHADYARTADVKPPSAAAGDGARKLVENWNAFAATLSLDSIKAGFGEHDNAPSRLLQRYRNHVRGEFSGDIDALNKAWTEENIAFDGVTPPFERTALRSFTPDLSQPKMRDWYAFKKALPSEFRIVALVDPLYRTYLRQDVYENDLQKLNATWGTSFTDWTQITLPHTAAEAPPGARSDWETFVRTKFPLRMLMLDQNEVMSAYLVNEAWRTFLVKRGRKGGAQAVLPFPPPFMVPAPAQVRTDWMDFVAGPAPLAYLQADSPENSWRASLSEQFGTVEAANAAFGTTWRSFAEAQPPQPEADHQFAMANARSLRSEFAGRNFLHALRYVQQSGQTRAILNTFIFCTLAILTAVIVNPMCAYALSRYPLPYAYKVLLFLLATMAFPAEVAMIPNFLLLRDLHLLNTFWALVLPGLASGFSIFLLKGFFDSLPKELYEAGILDGATEITLFRRITIPLSLPIFSVIALNAFTGSYGAFLFALVTCQDPRMWTLMVWLYNLQASAPQYVIMAALTLAALPTLLVFLLAQKVIMRGIILPSFK